MLIGRSWLHEEDYAVLGWLLDSIFVGDGWDLEKHDVDLLRLMERFSHTLQRIFGVIDGVVIYKTARHSDGYVSGMVTHCSFT